MSQVRVQSFDHDVNPSIGHDVGGGAHLLAALVLALALGLLVALGAGAGFGAGAGLACAMSRSSMRRRGRQHGGLHVFARRDRVGVVADVFAPLAVHVAHPVHPSLEGVRLTPTLIVGIRDALLANR